MPDPVYEAQSSLLSKTSPVSYHLISVLFQPLLPVGVACAVCLCFGDSWGWPSQRTSLMVELCIAGARQKFSSKTPKTLRPQELAQSKTARIQPKTKFQLRMKMNTKSEGTKVGDQSGEYRVKNGQIYHVTSKCRIWTTNPYLP